MGRPWSPLSVRLSFWKGLDEGYRRRLRRGLRECHRVTAYRWLGEDRQVLPSPFQNSAVPRSGSLSLREREDISFQLARGQGVRQIAGQLGRAPSTISREVARSRVYDRYVPSLAQEQT
jgi:IS30 family transposase